MRKGVKARDFRSGDTKGDVNKVIRFKSARARRLKAFSVEQLTLFVCAKIIYLSKQFWILENLEMILYFGFCFRKCFHYLHSNLF